MLRASRPYESLKRIGLTLFFSATILIITMVATEFGEIANASTVAFCFLILVLLSAFFGDLTVAIATSIVATMCFNYFFLPPIGTFWIATFDNWIAMIAFLFAAIAISRLTAAARENKLRQRIQEKTDPQLKEFGLWLLSVPREQLTFSEIAEKAVRILSLDYCSIHIREENKWKHFSATGNDNLRNRVEESLSVSVEEAHAVELIDEKLLGVRSAQIRKGMEPFLVLVVKSDDLPVSALNLLMCMIGLVVSDMQGSNRIPNTRKS